MSSGFGIIGCGVIADTHARAIRQLSNTRLVGCFDLNSQASDCLATSHGCRAFDSLDALLDDPSIDVVTIATPSGRHLEPALAAAAAGKHLIVEKPLEVTLERCDQLIGAAERHGVKLSTISQLRFLDSSRQLKQTIDSGGIGRPILAGTSIKVHRNAEYYRGSDWRGTVTLDGGGVLMNQGIHGVDLLLWLMGNVIELTAHTARLVRPHLEVEDTAVAAVKFANGALGTIEASTAVFPDDRTTIDIRGSEGTAVLREHEVLRWEFSEQAQRSVNYSHRPTESGNHATATERHEAHARQFRDVLTAIVEDRAPAIDGQQGRLAVELVLAIYRASSTGERILLPTDSLVR